MKRLFVALVALAAIGCGPDWKKTPPPPSGCPDGATLVGAVCQLPAVCPVGATLSNGACYYAAVCPVGTTLTDAGCLLPATTVCPVATAQDGALCYLPAVCPVGSTLTGDKCLLPAVCPDGAELVGSACVIEVICIDDSCDGGQHRACHRLCKDHAQQNEGCSEGWLSRDVSCDCPPVQCRNQNDRQEPAHCEGHLGTVYAQ